MRKLVPLFTTIIALALVTGCAARIDASSLYDQDGFLLVKEAVAADRLTRILDDNRETAGFEVNATAFCDKEVYSRIASWSVGWSERK